MRLLIVSNRLPVTVLEKNGKPQYQESVGGLVTGLTAMASSSSDATEYLWVGWPGSTISDGLKERVRSRLRSKHRALPVFFDEKDLEKFYYGFCNKTIWPLFHYLPSYVVYDAEYWENYKHINEIFAEAVMQNIKPDDLVWVHDYHLMLLPKLIREKMPDVSIGFFLHIPFPSFEIFRLFPSKQRAEILEGLLGADLVGFHTHDYVQYFLRCVLRILGYEHSMGEIPINDRVVKVDTFPMGADYKKFSAAAKSAEIEKEKNKLKKRFAETKIILSIDRLDYTKGIPNRLLGFEKFLEKNPQWQGRATLVMIVVPSRTGVEQYQTMKRQLDELVGKINGRFGTMNWTPILYQYKFFSFLPLTAFYGISDVALVTPLRDGMNLVAKEYIATRTDKRGVLILSEMAGAAKELGEAIIINPNNTDEIADALKEALEMSEDEQIRRNTIMQKRIEQYDVVKWADDFIQGLRATQDAQKKVKAKLLNSHIREEVIQAFKKAKRRLIFLDYDGTLAPFVLDPQMAKPSEEILRILKILSDDEKNEVVLISGRDKNTLQNWFGHLNMALVAEHGAFIKERGKNWKESKPLTCDWKPQILSILETYKTRLPRSFIEDKECSVVLHYRASDPEQASLRTKELVDNLVHLTANMDIQILQGSKVVEIRTGGVNKGIAGACFIAKSQYDFILAAGDDWTDEDLFKALPESAWTLKVGVAQTDAKYTLSNYADVAALLGRLARSETRN